ncbi:TIGR04190 family B12-binding domain/radical SAM domain protein [Actinomycetota bacterium]
MRNPFRRDLVLLHPPSVYDFRSREIFMGPIADAVPSTSAFEMYPVGLTSIASFLEKNHYNVQIVNLAYRMMKDPKFDVDRYLAQIDGTVFGIDLHWLPHAQGGLALAELAKKHHPETRVLFGGLSASYYHEELIRYPFVDFVVRGDSTEEPVRQLLSALRRKTPLEEVENLTWKRPDGTPVVNPLTFIPQDLDYVDVPDYRYALRSVFKYGNLDNLIPYLEWMRYPITMLLNSRGCAENCAVCGGSVSAYRQICDRTLPAYRSPEKLVEDVRTITSFSRAPIFVVHDPRMGGTARYTAFFSQLAEMDLANELVLELFRPGGDDFFEVVAASVERWSAQITIESPVERLRRINAKFPYSNEALESTIQSAFDNGCQKMDLFFMVGLPHQTYDDALEAVSYYEHLLDRFEGQGLIQAYVAPLSPFLDPGSRAFEDPKFGYHVRYKTLEEHRDALLQPSWKDILSYETDAMNREEITRATYQVARELNQLKYRNGLIDAATYNSVGFRLRTAESVLADLDHAAALPLDKRDEAHRQIRERVQKTNGSTLCGEDEMKWPLSQRFHLGATLARGLAAGLGNEVAHTIARLRGQYDASPYSGVRAEPHSLRSTPLNPPAVSQGSRDQPVPPPLATGP